MWKQQIKLNYGQINILANIPAVANRLLLSYIQISFYFFTCKYYIFVYKTENIGVITASKPVIKNLQNLNSYKNIINRFYKK